MLHFILFLVAALLLGYSILKRASTKATPLKLPNGPTGLPIVGNILQMFTTHPHLKCFQWAQQYGDMFTIYLGSRPALVINDAKVLKQLLNLDSTTGKFRTYTFMLASQGQYGIIMTEGEQHSEQRTACLKAMKAVGFGGRNVTSLERNTWSEIPRACDFIQNKLTDGLGKLVIFDIMHEMVANTLWMVVSGERLEGQDSSKVAQLLHNYMEAFQYSGKTGLYFLPWLRHVAPNISGYNALKTASDNFYKFVKKTFEKEKSTWRENTPPRHIIDCYIEQLRKGENNQESSFFEENGVKNSIASLVELFIAGIETTAATLTWIIFYISCCPKVQTRLEEEIDKVIGKNRIPCLEDRHNMPYTEAVILEALRYSSIAPLGLVHEVLEDIPDFLNFSLPKGLLLIPNLYRIHHNKDIWGDPEIFRPERFLDDNIPDVELAGYQKARQNLVPFQAGKRICLGEQQARDFMFMMVTHLFQRFQMKPDPCESEKKYFEPNVGFALLPQLLGLQINLRY